MTGKVSCQDIENLMALLKQVSLYKLTSYRISSWLFWPDQAHFLYTALCSWYWY